ncbi:hypothetical protein MNB_SV-6-743 [hydrothermal vent metagenome]|uniref:DUF4276 family protein n=1 Tax=hydrothermal vent metagenome TaxID=652676 RepID=A0A1W1BN19_9ZZZZ
MSIRIFVEGNDDKKFIVSLLNDLKKDKRLEIQDSVNFNNYIEVMGSKSKLLDREHIKYNRLSQKIGFEIKKTLFIFDCDFEEDDKNCNGIEKSQKCFDNLLVNLNWNIATDVYIFNRNLDYFLLETINKQECYEHFDKLLECLDVEKVKPNKKPIANLYRDLHPYPQFDFTDDRFQPLKDKLIDLFKGMEI